MSDEQVAARDATFDNVVPERLWISVRSSPDRKYILVIADINGIEKEIQRVYVGDYDGVLSSSTQLTWVLNQSNDALKTKLQAAEGEIAKFRQAVIDAEFVLEGSRAIGGQTDAQLEARENALQRFLEVYAEVASE